MGHDILAHSFGLENNSLQFFEAVLRRIDLIAWRHGASAGHDLQMVDTLT